MSGFWRLHPIAEWHANCVLEMKSAALKILAVSGVALAAYPIVTSYRQEPVTSPQLPQIIRPSEFPAQSLPSKPAKPETAFSLSLPPQMASGAGNFAIIKPDSSGHFIAKASINGIALPLLFDTGASIIALSFEDATKLGIRLLPTDFRAQIQTANGFAIAAEVTLREVRVEGIMIQDVSAMVLPPGKLETSLLGRSFWGRLRTGFSYAAGNLVLKN